MSGPLGRMLLARVTDGWGVGVRKRRPGAHTWLELVEGWSCADLGGRIEGPGDAGWGAGTGRAWACPAQGSPPHTQSFRAAVTSPFGTRDRFHGRHFPWNSVR